MTSILRTPENRFACLPGMDLISSRYVDLPGFEGLRMHYADTGPVHSDTVFLCLHGEPTWAYLYRKMLTKFAQAGYRALAPDLFGFGRSDKPAEETWYTFERHRSALLSFIDALDLRNVCLVCQDWGGLLGLTLPVERPDRVTRMLLMNTTFGTGDSELSPGFLAWRQWVREHPDMDVGRLMGRACPMLTPEECRAYDAPFPDHLHKAGARRFPELVPDRTDAPGAVLSRRARQWLSRTWKGQSFFAVGMRDPVLGPVVMEKLRQQVRGAPPPMIIENAGHFVPEWGDAVATAAMESFFS